MMQINYKISILFSLGWLGIKEDRKLICYYSETGVKIIQKTLELRSSSYCFRCFRSHTLLHFTVYLNFSINEKGNKSQ